MTDGPILSAARELAVQVAALTDTAHNERSIRAVQAFALKQRAEGVKEAAMNTYLVGYFDLSEQLHRRFDALVTKLEAQAREIEEAHGSD